MIPGLVVVRSDKLAGGKTSLLLLVETGQERVWRTLRIDHGGEYGMLKEELIPAGELQHADCGFDLYSKAAFERTSADDERASGPPSDVVRFHSAAYGHGVTLHVTQREAEEFSDYSLLELDSDVLPIDTFIEFMKRLHDNDLLEVRGPKELALDAGAYPDLIAAAAVARSIEDYVVKNGKQSDVARHYEGFDKFRGAALAAGLRYAAWSDVAVDFTTLLTPWGFFLDDNFADAVAGAGFGICGIEKLNAGDLALITALMQLPIKETGGRAADALATVTRNLGIQ